MRIAATALFALTCLCLVPQPGNAADSPQTISIHAKRFSFQPSEITLHKGEAVKLELTSEDVTHSLVVRELNINSTINKGRTTEVSITPDKTGDFHGRCGRFCGTGHGSMTFVVHVVEK